MSHQITLGRGQLHRVDSGVEVLVLNGADSAVLLENLNYDALRWSRSLCPAIMPEWNFLSQRGEVWLRDKILELADANGALVVWRAEPQEAHGYNLSCATAGMCRTVAAHAAIQQIGRAHV